MKWVALVPCAVMAIGIIVTSATARAQDREAAFLAGETLDCPGCNLAGVSLKRRNLAGADLSGANLQEASLHKANLRGPICRGPTLLTPSSIWPI